MTDKAVSINSENNPDNQKPSGEELKPTPDYVNWFRHSAPYINAHRNKTFVLVLPGEAIQHSNLANIIHDIALLNSLGIKLILVHGARPQIEDNLQAAKLTPNVHQNLRVTDAGALKAVIHSCAEIKTELEALLSMGLPNSPMHGAHLKVMSGNFITAKPYGILDGVDLHFTGKVRKVDSAALINALEQNSVVVISPLGYSPTGETFNLCHTDVATHVAAAVNADKLISFIDADGLYQTTDKEPQLLHELNLAQCEAVLASNTLTNSETTLLSVAACHQACCIGVARAQLISFKQDGALLNELFTRDGNGTMIYSDQYEQLRIATIDDVGGILELLAPLENEGVLVKRSRDLLEQEINQFTILEKDGTIIACAALYPFGKDQVELACVATHPDYRKAGRAGKLLNHLTQQANKQGFKEMFVLTTQTSHWFQEQGFVEGDINSLPDERQSLYNFQRSSKVFIRPLK